MLELSEEILLDGFTIVVSQEQRHRKELRGMYIKESRHGFQIYELPSEDLNLILSFPNITNMIKSGDILQTHAVGTMFKTVIGRECIEDGTCDKKYLEAFSEVFGINYCDSLIELDAVIEEFKTDQDTLPKQYKKLYKGDIRYE